MERQKVYTFVTDNLRVGGAERAFVQIVSWLKEHRPDITLRVLLFRAEGPFLEDLPEGVEVVALPSGPGFVFRNLRRFIGLIRILRRNRSNVLISFETHVNQFLLFALLFFPRTTIIVVEQCAYSFDSQRGTPRAVGFFEKILAGMLYRRAKTIVVISQGLQEEMTALFSLKKESFALIHNPVDVAALQAFRQEPARLPFVYAFLGRFVEQKNPALLLEAFSGVCQSLPPRSVTLRMIGYGPLEESLKALAERKGVSGSLEWLGLLKNPWQALAGCHCLVLSSRFEGFANVLVEALALGIPVIATDCPYGPREIIAGHPWIGILIPRDDRQSLTNAMESLRSDYDSWARHTAARVAYARRFSIQEIGASYQRILAL